jgi:hypothetical protein
MNDARESRSMVFPCLKSAREMDRNKVWGMKGWRGERAGGSERKSQNSDRPMTARKIRTCGEPRKPEPPSGGRMGVGRPCAADAGTRRCCGDRVCTLRCLSGALSVIKFSLRREVGPSCQTYNMKQILRAQFVCAQPSVLFRNMYERRRGG